MTSPLRDFNRRSVDDLFEEGVHMVYDFFMIRGTDLGYWQFNYNFIGINPNLIITAGKVEEDITIIHEWLHAYEDLILDVPRSFKESQVDWWAYHHQQRDSLLAAHIRSYFEDHGFKHNLYDNNFLKRRTLKGACLTPLKRSSSNQTLEKSIW